MSTSLSQGQYQAPTYRVEPGEAWFHFLHGNVPGHEIDFIYHPEVPQKPLTKQHMNHLVGLLKFIEPRQGMAYAFAIANLSLGDSQFEPGHGGVAFVFGLRIRGAYDHAGRNDPPFCHAAALINRHLDAETIYGVSAQFYQKLLPDEESRVEGSGWYHTYVDKAQNADALPSLLRGYVQDFADVLYAPPPSQLSLRWTVEPPLGEKNKVPRRVVIVYPDKADFSVLSYCMARIAAVLVESDLRWTAISNGRESDIAGGVAIRFVPRREAENAPEDVVLMYLEQVPEDPAEIARLLFGMYPARQSRLPELRVNIPTALAPPAPLNEAAHAAMHAVDVPNPAGLGGASTALAGGQGAMGFDDGFPQRDVVKELRRKERKQSTAMIAGVALFALLLGVAGLLWMLSAPKPVDGTVASAQPVQSGAPVVPPGQTNPAPVATNPAATQPTGSAGAPSGGTVTVPTTKLTVKPPSTGTKKTTKGKGDDGWQ
ncbi:MAG TPA: hypothetical protein PKA58_14730 [Polyangium sp.]|nr:hypothetical protein [Polyangium sp.]